MRGEKTGERRKKLWSGWIVWKRNLFLIKKKEDKEIYPNAI